MDIAKIDRNLRVEKEINKPDIVFYDCREQPFSIHGLLWEDGFCRMPASAARRVSENVCVLSRNTAGGRVRFQTDSPYVAISCNMPSITRFPHMALLGTTGFDLYADGIFMGTFRMPVELSDGYEAVLDLGEPKMRELMIGFPLYNDVSALQIGLAKSARIFPARSYEFAKPIVFYGSSITQGGCVCHPGISYPAVISRKLNTDYWNLGFSGSAKGEETMAEYIGGLSQSVFVYDYDHNAPSIEHLASTHPAFFRIIREKQKELPVVMVSMPNIYYAGEVGRQRREIIRSTYEQAKEAGDQNVWFVDGGTLWEGDGWDDCSVDKCHPNDLGHWRMAEKIGAVLRQILMLQKK